MPKYEAVINLTAEVDAASEEEANQLFLGELTNRLLHLAKTDNTFKFWVDVSEILELEGSREL